MYFLSIVPVQQIQCNWTVGFHAIKINWLYGCAFTLSETVKSKTVDKCVDMSLKDKYYVLISTSVTFLKSSKETVSWLNCKYVRNASSVIYLNKFTPLIALSRSHLSFGLLDWCKIQHRWKYCELWKTVLKAKKYLLKRDSGIVK